MSGIARLIGHHLDDVRSDFSVFHRVDDLESMPARRFLAFLPRIPAYAGAVAMAIHAEARPDSAPTPARVEEPVVDVRQAMANDPLFMGLGTAVSVPAA